MFKFLLLNTIRRKIEKKMTNHRQFCHRWRRIVNLLQNQKQRMRWTLKTISFATKKHEALLRTRTLILSSEQESCRQKNLCLWYKRKLFKQDSNQDRSWSKSSTKNSRKRFVSLSKKQKILFRKKRLKKSFIKISTSWTFRSNFASF
jgi:exonuclease VII large subunit